MSFIRPTDTVGKNRQASGHKKPFLHCLEGGFVCLKHLFFPTILVHLIKDITSVCKPCPHCQSLNTVAVAAILLQLL